MFYGHITVIDLISPTFQLAAVEKMEVRTFIDKIPKVIWAIPAAGSSKNSSALAPESGGSGLKSSNIEFQYQLSNFRKKFTWL